MQPEQTVQPTSNVPIAPEGEPGDPAGPSLPPEKPDRPGKKQTPKSGRGYTASLAPIKPADFGFAQARHLLLRAGFGGTPTQIRTLVKWGPTKSVDHLLNYESIGFEAVSPQGFDRNIMRPATAEERGDLAKARRDNNEEAVARLRAIRQDAERLDREQIKHIQRWWLKRMIETPRPLEEKMTLFWHGHFATSYRTIEDSYHMYVQNDLFRSHAVGNYGKLLYAIIRDPAMIAYLDNNDSRKGKPNENLARELMELFSLGVGNYTEQDIKEGARALTGYTYEDDDFKFQKNNHDTGNKRILGRSGTLDGEGFVGAILEQPACARYMAQKLYKFFVCEYPTGRKDLDSVAKNVMSSMESDLLGSRYEIKPLLRRLFLSEHFYQPAMMNEQVKSPTDLVVGMIRQMTSPVRDLAVLTDAMNMMGQGLFFPPSVKGWSGGRSWINTATLYIRQNIACFLLTGRTPTGFDPLSKTEVFDAETFLKQMRPNGDFAAGAGDTTASPGEIIDQLLVFCLGYSAPHNRRTLVEFVESRGGKMTPDVLTQVLLLVTAMPEYQLC